jgi:arylsulfatase A-like enzyme
VKRPFRPARAPCLASVVLAGLLACGAEPRPATDAARPNVLFVVWDTVRADRLSLYGYGRPTTPKLERWARTARVFDAALAIANSTVPNHASLFTGLLPSEHGAHAAHQYLDDHWTTLAELFRAAGYRTYLWSANPHLSDAENFTQGFELAEHPWSARNRDEATRIVLAKLPEDDLSNASRRRLRQGGDNEGLLKAAGALAQRNALEFLEEGDPAQPWLVFINYMEAHRHYIPARSYRELMMSPELVERSYRSDRSFPLVWAHTFGLRELAPDDLQMNAGLYDASLRELDDLFAELLAAFEGRGLLENTAVVLTSDHGELLGEHGLLGHQYSLYDPLLRVPLILRDPARVPAGRSDAAVLAMDLFPTLLELAGIEPPSGPESHAASLLAPPSQRARLAEYPAAFTRPLETTRRRFPDFDPAPWQRRLRAFHRGPYKLIEAEDGSRRLYDLASDPLERVDLARSDPETTERLRTELFAYVQQLTAPPELSGAAPRLDPDEVRRLEALGYAATAESGEAQPRPAAQTSSWAVGPTATDAP